MKAVLASILSVSLMAATSVAIAAPAKSSSTDTETANFCKKHIELTTANKQRCSALWAKWAAKNSGHNNNVIIGATTGALLIGAALSHSGSKNTPSNSGSTTGSTTGT